MLRSNVRRSTCVSRANRRCRTTPGARGKECRGRRERRRAVTSNRSGKEGGSARARVLDNAVELSRRGNLIGASRKTPAHYHRARARAHCSRDLHLDLTRISSSTSSKFRRPFFLRGSSSRLRAKCLAGRCSRDEKRRAREKRDVSQRERCIDIEQRRAIARAHSLHKKGWDFRFERGADIRDTIKRDLVEERRRSALSPRAYVSPILPIFISGALSRARAALPKRESLQGRSLRCGRQEV